MKVLLINPVCGQGSTGRICVGIAETLRASNHTAYIAYALGNSDFPGAIKFSTNVLDYWIHNILSRLTDSEGLHSTLATKRLISKIDHIKPDVIHIHTMHGHYLNIKLLLEYLDKINIPIVMTLHDCWIFTGHCAHFEIRGCQEWKTGCKKCKFLDEYPKSWFVDKSNRNFNLKKRILTAIGDKLKLVSVSYWQEELLRQSFLKDMNIQTIHNGIDLSVFKPTYNSELRVKYGLESKKVILGIALPWSTYKGFSDFLIMRELLSEEYSIIMVGLSEVQISQIPDGIIGITRVDNMHELAELYTLADVFVNTTYCDNYPTVNLEAIACGTPVITYRTGGSPESVDDSIGMVVEQGDIEALIEGIHFICEKASSYKSDCIEKAKNHFDKYRCFNNYIDIYKKAIE